MCHSIATYPATVFAFFSIAMSHGTFLNAKSGFGDRRSTSKCLVNSFHVMGRRIRSLESLSLTI
ncbi:hypothetical protein P175DRAFT_0498263 [Aspergillus ochraceoroseus IBT 24754]|uniref:Uncharacterized protein n=1 Tax=Aspergillus ochraceoroseus IBT 24754 TaxID=1392256 RepID=A0A2T5M9D2_9EURO|nr:uncharacterized protein P175DRAFT_0498263 [Aspergillus ochraceoroseus IBT 24754]PTU25153.1 hypothetical protein P175DRAFT_0498263 [Aspergillus ochraceoroseus IBT 24754]